ncbi:hypothetical protein N7456_005378 [Penicillium angulare]|uniref:Uncharacterized protein n=1 Tax=Penicillium angulare TaxID=116970 RepID=A0A9W9KKG5_9EURO|nr:hypothetical protein N7456_005378 [Penicillium angulare]
MRFILIRGDYTIIEIYILLIYYYWTIKVLINYSLEINSSSSDPSIKTHLGQSCTSSLRLDLKQQDKGLIKYFKVTHITILYIAHEEGLLLL